MLFKHLLSEIAGLGAKVVYANTDRIILDTRKSNLEEA